MTGYSAKVPDIHKYMKGVCQNMTVPNKNMAGNYSTKPLITLSARLS
jgi:hypothetical protein